MLTWLLLVLFVKDFPLMNATALDGFNYANSVFPLWEQVDYFSKMLESIMNQTSDSIILLCFSQGTLDFEKYNTMYKNVHSISSDKKWGGKLLFHRSPSGFWFFFHNHQFHHRHHGAVSSFFSDVSQHPWRSYHEELSATGQKTDALKN